MTLVHPHGGAVPAGSRLVLRMWAVDIELTNGEAKLLWIGSVVEEHLDRPIPLLTVAWTQPDMNTPRGILAAALDGGRLVTRAGVLFPGQAAHPFRDDGAHPFRSIAAQRSD